MCKYEKDKIYRDNNKEKISIKNKRNWLNYKGTSKQKEVNKRKCASYQKRNPEYFRISSSSYRARKYQAMPYWVDLDEIKLIYINCPEGHEVDHIIPLKSSFVCGLHVPWNLQYLTTTENRQKSNKVQ